MQIENKRNIKDVQHLLGHKDAKTTQLHYNSVIDQELDYEGAELLDSLFMTQHYMIAKNTSKKMFPLTT